MATPAEAFERLLEVLDKMKIPYYVGGPVASSADLLEELPGEPIAETRERATDGLK